MIITNVISSTGSVFTGNETLGLTNTRTFLGMFDWIALFVFIIYAILTIGLSTGIRTNPILFIIFLILYMPIVFLSGAISNFTTAFYNDAGLLAYTAMFPVTFTVLNNLPLFCLVIFVIAVIVNFLAIGGGGEGYA